MGKINRVKEGEMLFAIREDGDRICQDCRYNRDCSERNRIERFYDEGVVARIQACSMYESKPENSDKKIFFGDLT